MAVATATTPTTMTMASIKWTSSPKMADSGKTQREYNYRHLSGSGGREEAKIDDDNDSAWSAERLYKSAWSASVGHIERLRWRLEE